MPRTATIIGGGIAGLAAAIYLRAHAWRVTVYERASALPTTGTALGLWPGALAALETLGVAAAVRAAGRPQAAAALLRPDGSRIATLDAGRLAGEPVYLLSRPPLLRLLAGALDPGTIHFDAPGPDLADLTDSDVVIAADGLNSGVRSRLFGELHQARYIGATAWRGTVPGDTDTTTETWGHGARFGITPQESGRTNWFAGIRVAEGWRSPAGEVAVLKEHFGGWHAGVRQILEGLTEGQVLRHDLYHLDPPLPSYVRGNVALVGDAAHAMTPDLGRGACEALVDGVSLASHLVTEETVASALAAYDAQRRRPTQRLARASRLMNRIAHARRLTRLRDGTVRLALALR